MAAQADNDRDRMVLLNSQELRRSLRAIGREAELYADELRARGNKHMAGGLLLDHALAKFYAYDAMSARAWNTAEELTQAAQQLCAAYIQDRDVVDQNRFEEARKRELMHIAATFRVG